MALNRLLIVGSGSVGKRHLANFIHLGVPQLGVVDIREDRLEEVRRSFAQVATYPSLGDALKTQYEAAVICTPTVSHMYDAAGCVDAGAHLLVEKPISDTLDGTPDVADAARARGLVFMVGYTYRFWPPLIKVKEILTEGSLGRPLSTNVVFSQYLPDWHPWEDYRSWFMASAAQGGGALLDESHAIDLVRWLFGDVSEVTCAMGRASALEITSDDYAHLLLGFVNGGRAVIQLDLLGRKAKRRVEITCEGGELSWDFAANRIEIFDAGKNAQRQIQFTCERNEMFLAEAAYFLDAVAGRVQPLVSADDAIETLRVLLAARAADGRRAETSGLR